jgi:DNA modification methylase
VADYTLHHGDALEVLRTLPDASVDCVITDPPYPEIDRPYGRLTEAEWWALIVEGVIPQVRRILKPTGSAVFILQPNSRKVGSMRSWLWEFMAWACREWNMVQDAWWWNCGALPTEMANHQGGMRSAVKACVWLGSQHCYRDQSAVLMEVSEITRVHKNANRHDLESRQGTLKKDRPSGLKTAWKKRGGTTPHNLIVCSNNGTKNPSFGHGSSTPMLLADWWVRYISPPDGVVLDPFIGSGTMGIAALKRGRSIIGIERDPGYFAIAERRIAEVESATPLLDRVTA